MRTLALPPRRMLSLALLALLFGAAAARAHAQEGSTAPTEKEERVYTRDEVTKPAVIVSMPDPAYYNSGDKLLDLSGAVKISVVLSASGRVTDVQLLEGLSQNQNFASLKAARRVKFMPATKDGIPVSQAYVASYAFQVTHQENGRPEELKGLTKFYVDAGGDREALGDKPIAPDKRRVLMYYVGSKGSFVESSPVKTFVRAFAYEYKKANGLGD